MFLTASQEKQHPWGSPCGNPACLLGSQRPSPLGLHQPTCAIPQGAQRGPGDWGSEVAEALLIREAFPLELMGRGAVRLQRGH